MAAELPPAREALDRFGGLGLEPPDEVAAFLWRRSLWLVFALHAVGGRP